ncbi:B3/4 domain-containing protein [Sinobaca sp. H24]|uniref:B3/B4 domain-containing protein n=1 Tax=Sinobaca sp. H24 TaxID=2923376 RepID=UPI00207A33AA|nr:phenylalanine--tRNA ligase beta subunit-related protein [Sinobaca sp. H24]
MIKQILLDKSLLDTAPGLKIGVIHYKDIIVGDSPKMIKGRLQFYQETMHTELQELPLTEKEGILEWRKIFKAIGTDPSRYRPSHESLARTVKKTGALSFVHSAVDLNNFFSIQYMLPVGIYDASALHGTVTIKVGGESDTYEGLNGRDNNFEGKIVSADDKGAFGSPIVDSHRTKTTIESKEALQLFYLPPSLPKEEAVKLLAASSKMFHQIHSGEASTIILDAEQPAFSF